MRLVVAFLARQEAAPDRHFARVLRRASQFADRIVVLDDGSTDGTAQLAREHGAIVRRRELATPAWGNEASARQELWDFALGECPDADSWVLINDADQELVGDVRSLCLSREVNAWSFVLYDLWSQTEYREDQFWRGHLTPRPWLFAPRRVPAGWTPEWSGRGIHPGHCPLNFPMVPGIAPPDAFYWLHHAYSTPAARQAKHAQYASRFHLMSDFERAHAASILQ